MSFVRDAKAELITQFTVPYKGTWKSVSANQITPDALYDSMNVFIRKGKLRNRPGLLLLNSTVFDAPVIGGAMAVTPNNKKLLAITKSKLYTIIQNESTWSVDTTDVFASNDNAVIDVAFIETASQYVALIASEGHLLKRWIEGSGADTVTVTVGIIPIAKSVCVAARRVVALIHPHTIVWTATLTYDNWPALAVAKIAQTNDLGICVKSLSNLTFVVYKERSIYLARAQAGSDAVGFAFSEPLKVEGPGGVHAVVDVSGAHMYMTKSGRIAIYDGTRYPQWIADGLWLYLQDDIDPEFAHKIFGVFDYRLHTVTFHYPKIGDHGAMYGVVIISLPLEGSGITTYASFLGIIAKPCSYGYEMRFNDQIDRSIIFTSTSGDCQSFSFDEATQTDDGVAYSCAMQTGLFPLPDMRHHHVSVEPYLERVNGNGHVNIFAVVSDMLESEDGNVITDKPQVIDLNNNYVQQYIGFEQATRFFGLRYEWLSSSVVRYAGMSLYGRALT